jgi:hypothetical protein
LKRISAECGGSCRVEAGLGDDRLDGPLPRGARDPEIGVVACHVPGGLSAQLDCGTIAARVIAFLPGRSSSGAARRRMVSKFGMVNNRWAVVIIIILGMILMVFTLGAQNIQSGGQLSGEFETLRLPAPGAVTIEATDGRIAAPKTHLLMKG